MSYERLTERYIDNNGNKYVKPLVYECEILHRLAELEDKIENGTLIELPCKVGERKMESEKVKEIKEKLQEEIFIATSFGDKLRRVATKDLQDILTYINELESENERLMKLQARGGYRVAELGIENQQLKDRIAELEKERAKNAQCLMQFAERVKEKLEEYRLENEYFTENEPNGNLWQMNSSVFCLEVTQDGGLIDETLKEFIGEKENDKA